MIGMDYRRVREALRERRFELRMSVPEVAAEAGVAKTTLYRLEDIENDPDREPDLDTIERLVTALDLTLSAFFARVEGGETPVSAPAPPDGPTPAQAAWADAWLASLESSLGRAPGSLPRPGPIPGADTTAPETPRQPPAPRRSGTR